MKEQFDEFELSEVEKIEIPNNQFVPKKRKRKSMTVWTVKK